MKRRLNEYIEKRWLIPSHRRFGAPVFLVKKPHANKMRLVCDWWALNLLTIENKWALPSPEILFSQLNGVKWMTQLHLAQGYHQVKLVDDDSDKSAIVTNYGN